DASALIESPANWLQRAFLLLAGLGTYWASGLALEQRSFPKAWALLGFVLAALYWLGLLSLLARDAALPVPDAVGGLLILLSGGLVAPIRGAWLGLRLPRAVGLPFRGSGLARGLRERGLPRGLVAIEHARPREPFRRRLSVGADGAKDLRPCA